MLPNTRKISSRRSSYNLGHRSVGPRLPEIPRQVQPRTPLKPRGPVRTTSDYKSFSWKYGQGEMLLPHPATGMRLSSVEFASKIPPAPRLDVPSPTTNTNGARRLGRVEHLVCNVASRSRTEVCRAAWQGWNSEVTTLLAGRQELALGWERAWTGNRRWIALRSTTHCLAFVPRPYCAQCPARHYRPTVEAGVLGTSGCEVVCRISRPPHHCSHRR